MHLHLLRDSLVRTLTTNHFPHLVLRSFRNFTLMDASVGLALGITAARAAMHRP